MVYEVLEVKKEKEKINFLIKDDKDNKFIVFLEKFFIFDSKPEKEEQIREEYPELNFSEELDKTFIGPGKLLKANNIPKNLLNEDFYCLLLSNCGVALQYIHTNDITEKMCFSAVVNDSLALKYVPKDLMTDDIIITALIKNGSTIQFVEKEKRCERYFELAFKTCPSTIRYMPKEYLTVEMCIDAVTRDMYCLNYVPENWLLYVYKKAVLDNNLSLPEYLGKGRKSIQQMKFASIVKKIKFKLQQETTLYFGLLNSNLTIEQTIMETANAQMMIDAKREYIDKLFELKDENNNIKKK